MRKIILLFTLLLAITTWSHSQCITTDGGNYPPGPLTMQNDGTVKQIASDNYPNAEFSLIKGLIIGNTYTVTGTNTTSIYITVSETNADFNSLGDVLGSGASSVDFTATTEEIVIFWHLDADCNTQESDDTVTTIECTSPTCICTETAAPDAATTPIPAHNATNVPIVITDGNASVDFAWTDGGTASNFDITLGSIGSINTAESSLSIYYDWQYNYTYSWNITSINCVGTETSSVFTFTTEADPEASVEEFDTNSISHFYNKSNYILELKSSTSSFTAIEVYDILGKTVLTKSLNNTEEYIDLSSLNSGVYISKITINDAFKTVKFVKD